MIYYLQAMKGLNRLLFVSFLLIFSFAKATEIEGGGDTFALCGGAIESDSDTLIFQKSSLTPGEICVWTIHLTSQVAFGLNFSTFDVKSRFLDCTDGGLRIYALNNNVNPEESHSYTFCNGQPPPPGNFFLGYTIAVVVLYVDERNTNPGSGFELNWSGSSFDPMRTKHVSSYSTASEGVIKYPVAGSYQTNVAATWLIKPQLGQVPESASLTVESVSLESCTVPGNSCACDSVVLYEVNSTGHLRESKKICCEEEFISIAGLELRFILAFFSDFEDLEGGTGFTATYFPGQEGTSSPTEADTTFEITTVEASTTAIPSTTDLPPLTECGTVIEMDGSEDEYFIHYKVSENYYPNERCTWIIRNNAKDLIEVHLDAWGVHPDDRLMLTTFQRLPGTATYRPMLTSNFFTGPGAILQVPGRVAVITFASSARPTGGTGFILHVVPFGGTPHWNVTTTSRDFSSLAHESGGITHPASGSYEKMELSLFLINQPNFLWQNVVTDYEIESLGLDTGRDEIAAYTFDLQTGWTKKWMSGDWPPGRRRTTNHIDLILFVFTADDFSNPQVGFNLNWQLN